MALAFTHLSWWLWSGKCQDPNVPNGSSLNSSPDSGFWESDTLNFPMAREANITSSSRKVRRKWHSREEGIIDREYDAVFVPSDGGCVSGSESDDSDYSIGWLEPSGSGLHSHADDGTDNSFAVLVPCYGRIHMEDPKKKNFDTSATVPDCYSCEKKIYKEKWISENNTSNILER